VDQDDSMSPTLSLVLIGFEDEDLLSYIISMLEEDSQDVNEEDLSSLLAGHVTSLDEATNLARKLMCAMLIVD
jgi:hypothetical protein